MKPNKPKLSEMLEDCLEAKTCSNSPFSKWEEDFLDSIHEQFEEKGFLTEKQIDTLIDIWEKI